LITVVFSIFPDAVCVSEPWEGDREEVVLNKVGGVETAGFAIEIKIEGNLAFISDLNSGLAIVDIIDPENPIIISTLNTGNQAGGLFVNGNFVYIGNESDGLRVIDISDPLNPFMIPKAANNGNDSEGVYVYDDIVYLADGDGGGIKRFTIDPFNPYIISSMGNQVEVPDSTQLDVFVLDGIVYVATWYGGLSIFDFSEEPNPCPTPGYPYKRGGWNEGSNPGHSDNVDNLRRVYVARDSNNPTSSAYAYLPANTGGLKIVNVDEPCNPVLVGCYDTTGIATGIFVNYPYAYVADGTKGLKVINIEDPTKPYLAGSFQTTGRAFDIGIKDDYVFVVDLNGLVVLKQEKLNICLDIDIDIKPGSFPNSINLGANGNVPVAILSSLEFDATTVNPVTVTLADAFVKFKGKGKVMASIEDVNDDGLLDMVVHVDPKGLQLSVADTDAILKGETIDGKCFQGSDAVRIVSK
jgi:hypothetical protein